MNAAAAARSCARVIRPSVRFLTAAAVTTRYTKTMRLSMLNDAKNDLSLGARATLRLSSTAEVAGGGH